MKQRVLAAVLGAALAWLPALAAPDAPAVPADLKPLTAAQVRQQLAELATVLEVNHPYLKDAGARARFDAQLRELSASVQDTLPAWQAWLLQQRLVRNLDDPHTALYPIGLEDQALAVKVDWVSDGILISPSDWASTKEFPDNSELLQLGPYDPNALLQKLQTLYPGTPQWVEHFNGLVGYQLRWLGVVDADGQVALSVRTPQGKVQKLKLPLVTLPKDWIRQKLAERKKLWFHWEVDTAHDVGWFTLDQMELTPEYEQQVTAFFAAVEQAGVTRVAVDLRHNGGGWSLAASPFMQYLRIQHYADYQETEVTDTAALQKEIDTTEERRKLNDPRHYLAGLPAPVMPPAEKLFHGKLYLVTGPGCFSSAMEFAADVKYNRVGTIVGRPCGEVVTGPGEVRFFADPASGVPFQVSTVVYAWPGVPAGAVVDPDVPIPTTVKDLQQGIDPERAWFDANSNKK